PLSATAGQQHRNCSKTSTSGDRHWRPVNGLDQHASQTPEQRCYYQKNWSEEALLHSWCAHSLAGPSRTGISDKGRSEVRAGLALAGSERVSKADIRGKRRAGKI